MTTRTTTTKGLSKPHKGEAAKPGIGSSLGNAKTIDTDKGGFNPKVGHGLPNTYFGNSKSISSTDKGKH